MIVLQPAEALQLLAAVDLTDPFGVRDRAVLVLCLHTGLRVAELVALDCGNVVTDDGAPRQAMHLVQTKGGRPRTVPLNVTAREAVATIVAFNRRRGFSTAPPAPLLATRKHERVTVRSVQRLVKALRERAQLDVPATVHSLRHSFATNVLSCNTNLRVVQQLLGHRRLSTVEVYTHPTRQDLQQAVERLEREGRP